MGDKEIIYEDEFNRWAESWEIDTDIEDMTEDDRDDFRAQKNQIIRAMKKDRLKYNNETQCMEYTVSRSNVEIEKDICLKRPVIGTYMQMDKYKEREISHKGISILSEMSGLPIALLSKLDMIDGKPLMAIATLFLAS